MGQGIEGDDGLLEDVSGGFHTRIPDSSGEPLAHALESGNVPEFKDLLKASPSADIVLSNGETLLVRA